MFHRNQNFQGFDVNFGKYLIEKTIKFDNVTKDDKNDDDQYNTCFNFSMNNLIHFLKTQDIFLQDNKKDIKVKKKYVCLRTMI
ncbi:MAG: hypothetical protein ICW73_02505 [Buchnera aphidicola (Pentalonia nigronervosa)]|jgi:hypothetical protein|uniref:Uncharacterized protein n=1 Tax=Buchnera aphidicola (Pentalonia nigronervosa) TaxID=1309793 RepID=A0A7H1AZB6_9GAMM|nr:MAG: hypothetical protein ICW73_02505 [Buchnera aphidicola (Pentalonia nigronervosa)]